MQEFNYNALKGDCDIIFNVKQTEPKTGDDDVILEAAGGSTINLAEAQMRSMAMGAVLTWVDGGEYSYTAFDEMMLGVCDLDGDEEISGDEEGIYTDLWSYAADAMLSLGADDSNVEEFLDQEDDDAGEKLGGFLSGVMDNMPSTDDEIVSTFATGSDGAVFECTADLEQIEDAILEAAYKKTRVVRDGKVVIKNKRISGKVRLSAAQKAGLKKARRRAHSSAARLARKKSLKVANG